MKRHIFQECLSVRAKMRGFSKALRTDSSTASQANCTFLLLCSLISHGLTQEPADQREFRMKNCPKPLTVPIKKVTYKLGSWVEGSGNHPTVETQKIFKSREISGLFSKTPFVSGAWGKKQVFWVKDQICFPLPVALVKVDLFSLTKDPLSL